MSQIGGAGGQYGADQGVVLRGPSPSPPLPARFVELLDELRTEYNGVTSQNKTFRSLHEEYERKVEVQLRELRAMENALHELDRKHILMKHQYEAEIARLKSLLGQSDLGLPQPPNLPAQNSIPSSVGHQAQPVQAPHAATSSELGGPPYAAPPVPAYQQGRQLNNFQMPSHQNAQHTTRELYGHGTHEHRPAAASPASGGETMMLNRAQPGASGMQPADLHSLPGSVVDGAPRRNAGQSPGGTRRRADKTDMHQGSIHGNGSISPTGTGHINVHPTAQRSKAEPQLPNSSASRAMVPVRDSRSRSLVNEGSRPTAPSGNKTLSTIVAPNPTQMSSTEQQMMDSELDFLVMNGKDQSGMVIDMDCKLLYTMEHSSVVCCVRYSPDGRFLATGANRSAHIFDHASGKRVAVLSKDLDTGQPAEAAPPLSHTPVPSPTGKSDTYVRAVCFSPDGKQLITGAEDHIVKIWDIESRTVRHKLIGHDTDIYSVDASSDGRFLVSGSGDRKAKIWDFVTGKQIMTLGGEYGPTDGITSVCVSPSSRHVAAGSLDKVVRVWDVETGQLVRQFNGHKDSVYSVAFSPDGKSLLSGSLDKTVKLWDLTARQSTGQCQLTFSGHKDFVLSVMFSPNGRWLISGSKDRTVQWWDPRYNEMCLMVQGHRNSIISIAHNPMSQTFASGSGDSRARGWIYCP